MKRLKVKTSDTQEMKIVFTAQSKHYFYCRDVVCEYVMKQGYLPLNPFRVFGYFLGDRVDRELVRRGNNQLIRTCDELWVFGSIADGVLFEIISAIEQNKVVKFFTIGSELKDINEIPLEKVTFEPEVHAAQVKRQDLLDFIRSGRVTETEDDLSGQITIFNYHRSLFEEGSRELKATESCELHGYNSEGSCYQPSNSEHFEEYEIAIIGLGSAGMMALKYLKDRGKNVIGIEKGKAPRLRLQTKHDISSGFGGCGLYSDGKLSFYPSASKLWERGSTNKLKTAYEVVNQELIKYGCEIPSWSDDWSQNYVYKSEEKIYESIYLDNKTSRQIIEKIFEKYSNCVRLETKVRGIEYSDGLYSVQLSSGDIIHAKRILVSTGKLGNSLLYNLTDQISFTDKYEYGIRVETNADNFIPMEHGQIDFKIIKRIDDKAEIRSFCSCKDGTVIESYYEDVADDIYNKYRVSSFNGCRSNERTGRSNIGLTIRSTSSDSTLVREIRSFLRNNSYSKEGEVEVTIHSLREIKDIIENENFMIGKAADTLLSDLLRKVIKSDEDKYNTRIFMPEIEYYGKYPLFNWETMKASDKGIWVAGDVSGEFRGLVASMISAIYAAMSILQEME